MAVYTAIPLGNGTIPFSDVAANTQMQSNNGYNVAGPAVMTLPVASNVGDIIRVALVSGASFTIAQNAGQSIIVLGGSTTVGTGGSIFANTVGAAVELECVTANLQWILLSDQSSLTIT